MKDILSSSCFESDIILSTSGFSSQSTRIKLSEDGNKIYMMIDDELTLKNLTINPRVSLYNLESNQKLSAITKSTTLPKFLETGKGKSFTLQIYRSEHDGEIFEYIKNKWIPYTKSAHRNYDSLTCCEKFIFWKKATRSVSLPLSFYPLLIGGLLAMGVWQNINLDSLSILLATLIGGVSAHLGINLLCDYHEFMNGVDTPDTLSSHPSLLAIEELSPSKALKFSLFLLAITAFAGGYLLTKVGLPVLFIGALGVLGGYAYTDRTFGLKYRGYGEVITFLLMGPLMLLGSYYFINQDISMIAVLISLAIGLLVSAVTLANNLRDIVYDKRAGFITLPMNVGIKTSKFLYFIMTYLPYLLILHLVFLHFKYIPLVIVLLSLPKANKAFKEVKETWSSPEAFYKNSEECKYPLNSIHQHSFFCLLLSVGVLATLFVQF